MTFTRILTNICSDNLEASRDFYVALLGFEVNYDSDWYIQLLTQALYEARGWTKPGSAWDTWFCRVCGISAAAAAAAP